jgi:hypothetical protein
MTKRTRIDREAAEAMAISALAYVAAEPERLGRFLALSGLGPETLRSAAREPQFLAGILEYLLADEELLVGFAREADIAPEEVGKAREALSGEKWERELP